MSNKMAINDYISSLGSTLPKDWTSFTVGGMFDNRCVFCSLSHDYNKVYRYNPNNKTTRESTDTMACDECQLAIDINLLRIEYPEFSEVDDDSSTIKTVVKDARSVGVSWNRRIRLFNDNYEFEDEVNKFITHLQISSDTWASSKVRSTCYFCEGKTESRFLIKVPVDLNDIITGGHVVCCGTCKPRLAEDNLSSDLTSILDVQSVICNNRLKQCDNRYLITTDEVAHRYKNKGDYLCPKCVYEQVNRLTAESKLYLAQNAVPRTGPMVRFIKKDCHYCGKTVKHDLTKDIGYLAMTELDPEDNSRCKHCRRISSILDLDDIVYWHSTSIVGILSQVLKDKNLWTYSIYSIDSKNVIEKVLSLPENVYYDVSNAMSLLVEACHKHTDGKQLNLFDNEDY